MGDINFLALFWVGLGLGVLLTLMVAGAVSIIVQHVSVH